MTNNKTNLGFTHIKTLMFLLWATTLMFTSDAIAEDDEEKWSFSDSKALARESEESRAEKMEARRDAITRHNAFCMQEVAKKHKNIEAVTAASRKCRMEFVETYKSDAALN